MPLLLGPEFESFKKRGKACEVKEKKRDNEGGKRKRPT
jgi:hypothetical protein